MQFTTKGLVLKEVKVGESDRILTVLTQELGLISVSARCALNLKNRLFAATGVFCYSEFTLFAKKNLYSVNEAEVLENFFDLRNSVEGIAVATYMAELLIVLHPHGREENAELLRLALNTLYVLSHGLQPPRLVKAVFELRAVSESGFRPNLLACDECGRFEAKRFYFDVDNGVIYCDHCNESHCRDTDITFSVLTAMRHSIYADAKKVYSFSVSEATLVVFSAKTEEYVLKKLDRPMKSLEFLKTVLP